MKNIPFSSARVWQHLVILLLLAGGSLHAATYTVSSNADTGAAGTLRWAIGQANANPGSTIQLNNCRRASWRADLEWPRHLNKLAIL